MGCQLDYTFNIYYLIKLLPKPDDFLHMLYRLLDFYTIYKAILGEIIERDICSDNKYKIEYESIDYVIDNIKHLTEIYVIAEFNDHVDMDRRDENVMWEIIDKVIRKIEECICVMFNENTIKNRTLDDITSKEYMQCAYGVIEN